MKVALFYTQNRSESSTFYMKNRSESSTFLHHFISVMFLLLGSFSFRFNGVDIVFYYYSLYLTPSLTQIHLT
jgi:hypothetical protein